jgi:ketosteroid isomerase-like protein
VSHLNLRSTLLLAAAVSLAGCAPQKAQDSAADVATLASTAAGWEKAYNEKNADAVAALYAEDAQLLPPGGPVVNGRPAIRDYWANDIAATGVAVTITSDASNAGGDWAWRSGAWSSQDAKGTPLTGKYVEVWHRTRSGWQIHRDIWNADGAPGASAAPPAR